jgi:hypothetical protein
LNQPRQPDDRVTHERRHVGGRRRLRVIGRVGMSGQAIAPSLHISAQSRLSATLRGSLAIWT